MTTFPPPVSQVVRVATTSGRIEIIGEARADVSVDGTSDITRAGGMTTVAATSDRLKLRVPIGTDIVVGTTSGRIAVRGVIGAASITTESGKVVVEQATSLDVRSESGAIDIGHCGDRCCLRSTSGSVAVGSCGSVDVATTNGKIALRDVRGVARAHCTSGRVDIALAEAHDVDAETISGRISVSLPAGVNAALVKAADGSPPGSEVDCTIRAQSVTGRVDIVHR